MSARKVIGSEFRVLASTPAVLTIATAVTTPLDWGTPDDLKYSTLAINPMERLVLLLQAVAAAATSTLAFTVSDAEDSVGSIAAGTLAAARTNGSLAPVAGTQLRFVGFEAMVNRPWLRVSAVNSGTESYAVRAYLLAVPSGI